MKKLLLPLLILLAFSAGAQFTQGTTGINSGYDWLRGVFRAQIAPTYADTSNYPNWVPRRAGHFMLDTAGTDKGTWYVRYDGYWHPIFGGGSGGGTDSLYTTLIGALGVEFLSSITGDSVSVYVTPYRNVDSLRKVSGAAAGQGASTLGYASPGDGGGASYWWDASSIATDDGGSIIDPIASGSGRWRLVINNGFLNPRQFGAKSGDGLDDYAAFQAANAFADSPNLTIEVPEGQFNLSTTLQLRDGVSLVGTSWVGSYINSLTSDTLIRMGSTCIVKNVYLRGADIGTVGLVMNDGSSMLVENVRFERFVLDGLLALVTNNSKVTNIKTQYNGRAQLRAVGTLNTDFTNIQANTDDAFNGVASTRGVYFEDTRNCHLHGGIIERGPGDAQGEFVNNEHLRISEIEFNNGKVGILVSGGTVTLDHVQFSNPIDFAAWAKNGGTINIINNGSPMVSGANGRPLPYLFRGNILVNGSSMYPVFSNSFGGSAAGSTIGAGTTIVYDSLRRNILVSTTLASAGISTGLGSSIYNVPPGQGLQYRLYVKNIAAGRLALYVGLVAGGRRFIGYVKNGYNVKNYTSRGDESYRMHILSSVSGANSWTMSLSELWLTSTDSTVATDTIPATDGAMEYALATSDSNEQRVFSTAQIKQLGNFIAPYFRRSGDSLYLRGYVNSPNSVYGQITSGVPTMIRAAVIDTTNRTAVDTTFPVYVAALGKHIYVPKPAGYTPPSLLQFIVGTTPLSPANGDSIVSQPAFVGKFPTIFRDGLEQYYNSTLPGSYQYSAGTLIVHPPFYTGEKVKIYLTSAPPDTIGTEAGWTFTTIGTNNNVLNASNVYTSTVTGFNWNASYALMAQTFMGDMMVRAQHKSDAQAYIIGLRDDNANSDYPSYDVGFYVNSTSGDIYQVTSGTPVSLGVSVSANDYIAIKRTGSTFVLQTSVDGTTWTTRHTFSYTSSATHYINLNLYSNSPYGKAYNIAIK